MQFFCNTKRKVSQYKDHIEHEVVTSAGGLWINLGPLLYHFSDLANENSIEPSYQVVREVIVGLGFEIEVSFQLLWRLSEVNTRTEFGG